MAEPPAKKPDPAKPPEVRVLPMELQVGDRLSDETGEWEVVGRPYSTGRGKNAHARLNGSEILLRTRYEAGAPTNESP